MARSLSTTRRALSTAGQGSTPTRITRARANVVTTTTPSLTEAEQKNGAPLFLRQLIDRLRLATSDSDAIQQSASLHGGELLSLGFTVSQVVHSYGYIGHVVTQLANEAHAPITVEEFHLFNSCLDDAIAHSVAEYERRRDQTVACDGTQRLAVLAHALRNQLTPAMLAFSMLQDGTVPVGGSTGSIVGRTLRAMRDLINNSLVGARLDSWPGQSRRVSVSELIGAVGVAASFGAKAEGFDLAVSPVAEGIDVEVDDQILATAIGILLQNAFEFSCPQGHIAMRTTATVDRVMIEIEDECGGLPPGRAEDLSRPGARRSDQRRCLGLGLTMSRMGVEVMGGRSGCGICPARGACSPSNCRGCRPFEARAVDCELADFDDPDRACRPEMHRYQGVTRRVRVVVASWCKRALRRATRRRAN